MDSFDVCLWVGSFRPYLNACRSRWRFINWVPKQGRESIARSNLLWISWKRIGISHRIKPSSLHNSEMSSKPLQREWQRCCYFNKPSGFKRCFSTDACVLCWRYSNRNSSVAKWSQSADCDQFRERYLFACVCWERIFRNCLDYFEQKPRASLCCRCSQR